MDRSQYGFQYPQEQTSLNATSPGIVTQSSHSNLGQTNGGLQPLTVSGALPNADQQGGSPKPRRLVFSSLAEALAYRRRVKRPLELLPEHDPSIEIVQANSHVWILKMVNAMLNMEDIYDQPGAIALPLFTTGHPRAYSHEDVEAACYSMFLTVIDRCKNGFRGVEPEDNRAYNDPRTFKKYLGKKAGNNEAPNQALDYRGTFQEDRTATCETRMQNVINCLHGWKNSCRDIMYHDYYQILLANHPLYYANQKAINQRGNVTKKHTADLGKQAVALLAEDQQGPKKKRTVLRKKDNPSAEAVQQNPMPQSPMDAQGFGTSPGYAHSGYALPQEYMNEGQNVMHRGRYNVGTGTFDNDFVSPNNSTGPMVMAMDADTWNGYGRYTSAMRLQYALVSNANTNTQYNAPSNDLPNGLPNDPLATRQPNIPHSGIGKRKWDDGEAGI
jgi:hypothetical protein